MSGKQIVMLKARLKSKDFCILIKGKPCFTDWPSKGDSKVINVLILALCQSESDARQFTLSETNYSEDRVTNDDVKSVINSLANSRNLQVIT